MKLIINLSPSFHQNLNSLFLSFIQSEQKMLQTNCGGKKTRGIKKRNDGREELLMACHEASEKLAAICIGDANDNNNE